MSKYTLDSDFDSTPEPIDPLKQVPTDPAMLTPAVTRAPLAKEVGPGRRRRVRSPFSLQWAAGFADGEASIFIYKQAYPAHPTRNPAYRLGFTITQNDRQILEHFKDGVGIHGGLYDIKREVGHNRQMYQLTFTGINALKLISILQPYLLRKQIEAQTAIAYWRTCHGGGHPGPGGWPAHIVARRERFYKKMKSLK